MPLARPELKPPATVETTPVVMTIARIRLLPLSVTKREPAPSRATPVGALKRAIVPMPSVLPAAVPMLLPPPASVVTCLVEMTIIRNLLFLVSATYSRPAELSRAMPSGLENLATLPMPSAMPDEPHAPARVETTRVSTRVETLIARMALFDESATYRVASALSTTRPRGPLNLAAPVPSAQPWLPGEPANADTVLVRVSTTRTISLPSSQINTLSDTELAVTPRMPSTSAVLPTPLT